MSAGDLLLLEFVGKVQCPTPACGYDRTVGRITKKADIIDIGERRFIICQKCGHHSGHTGKTPEQLRALYEEGKFIRDACPEFHDSGNGSLCGCGHPLSAHRRVVERNGALREIKP